MKYNDNVMVEIEPGGNNDVEHGKGMMVMGEGVLELNKIINCLINQYETFQHVLFSFTCFLGNFPKEHPSHYCSKPNILNHGVFK
ncbi:hypothetical protein JHK87_039556 [Glycine soja]|nr:hypothetical protein JHK87_039556 [Glycine soja]